MVKPTGTNSKCGQAQQGKGEGKMVFVSPAADRYFQKLMTGM